MYNITDYGPAISPESKKTICSSVESVVTERAGLLLDGDRLVPGFQKRNFLNPSILTDTSMKCYTEQIFGPVLVIMCVDTLDDAIKIINQNPYGNGTALFIRSRAAARNLTLAIEVGQRVHVFTQEKTVTQLWRQSDALSSDSAMSMPVMK